MEFILELKNFKISAAENYSIDIEDGFFKEHVFELFVHRHDVFFEREPF